MTDPRQAAILETAIELEQRDACLAAELADVDRLTHGVERVRARVKELQSLLAELPGELAALDAAEPDLHTARARAATELATAERRTAELEAKRRTPATELDQARREQATARDTLADADRRLTRLAARRAEFADLEVAGRAEMGGLQIEAEILAVDIASVPRISDAGRGSPAGGSDAITDWAARAHAALFVVRTQLETDRERVVREASELGAGVLGEPLGGSSVSVVRERIERAFGA